MNLRSIVSISTLGAALAVLGCDRATPEPAPDTGAKAVAKADGGVAGKPAAPATAEVVAELPPAEGLLDKAVEAQGGRAKLDALESFYLEGELAVAGQNITGTMKLWWKAGDFYTEQTMVGIGTVRAGKQGEVIWSEDPINGLRQLAGAEAEQHAWASSPSLPAHWSRYFAKAETTGEREIGGVKAYDVQLTSATGATVVLSFDAASGLQLAQTFKQTTPLGDMPISVELQDYREVDGLKLPHLQVTDAKLAKATQTLTKVEFGAAVDTAKFAMPRGGTAVVGPGGAAKAAVP